METIWGSLKQKYLERNVDLKDEIHPQVDQRVVTDQVLINKVVAKQRVDKGLIKGCWFIQISIK